MPGPIGGIRLVPLSTAHVGDLSEVIADPDSLRFTRIPEPPPVDFAATWVQRYVDGRETGEREGYAVVDDEDAFLGTGLLPVIDHASGTVEIGYLVSPPARGRGVGTRALWLLTERALELGAERMELHIAVANAASRRVAERCGYVLEGVLRSVYCKPGVRADTQVWSLLPTDPRPPWA
jgi:RimJ/RimL family protein N-acetyltransferase